MDMNRVGIVFDDNSSTSTAIAMINFTDVNQLNG